MNSTVVFEMEGPFRSSYQLHRLSFGSGKPEVSVVAGLHGNELNGIHSLNLLASVLQLQNLEGTVHLYPLVNSFGADQCEKRWPFDQRDINRSFPGDPKGSPAQRIAWAILEQTKHSDICIDVHSGASHIREVPQIRCDYEARSIELARASKLPVLWKRKELGTASSLLRAWTDRGQQALHIIGGRGTTLDGSLAVKMADGLMELFSYLGIMKSFSSGTTIVDIESKDVLSIRAECGGFFVPEVRVGERVLEGKLIGVITSPIGGERIVEYRAPFSCFVISVRANPMIHSQELLIRLVGFS